MLHTSKVIFTIGVYLDKWPHDVKYVWSFFMFVTKTRNKCHKKLIFTCLMKAFKSNTDYGHTPIFFFVSTIHVKDALIIGSYIWHLALKGKMKDVVIVGVTFNPNALTSLYDLIAGVIPTTLVSFVKGWKSPNWPTTTLGSSKFPTISSFKVITLCSAWHDSNAKMHFLFETEFPFASSSSTTTNMESLNSNLSQSLLSLRSDLSFQQFRHHPHYSKCWDPN